LAALGLVPYAVAALVNVVANPVKSLQALIVLTGSLEHAEFRKNAKASSRRKEVIFFISIRVWFNYDPN
jgi:hypothetical protein